MLGFWEVGAVANKKKKKETTHTHTHSTAREYFHAIRTHTHARKVPHVNTSMPIYYNTSVQPRSYAITQQPPPACLIKTF